MSSMLIFATTTITLALIFYTIGVFAERKSGILKKPHVLVFWLGFICDTIGTMTMGKIASSNVVAAGATQSIHGITGVLAIILMLFHALWATWVIYKNDEAKKKFFHKFSIIVWVIWLIPYFVGMFIGMRG